MLEGDVDLVGEALGGMSCAKISEVLMQVAGDLDVQKAQIAKQLTS